MRVIRLLLSIVLGFLLWIPSAAAQSASIAGRVTDGQGGAIVNAVVTLTSNTMSPRTATPAADGSFVLEGLPAGSYAVQVDAPGFASWNQTVIVSAGVSNLAVTLEIASRSETIDVFVSSALTMSTAAPTGTRLNLTPFETPASIQILPGEVIRERGDATIEEAETRMAGIVTQGAPGNGGTSRISRGFGGVNSLMKLYDGTQLMPGAGTITFPFDTWTVERIEYLAGPASVMYGNGAIGGALNVIPRRPNRVRTENAMRVTGGSNGVFRAAFGRGGPINDSLAYRFDVSQNRSSGWVDAGNSRSTAVSGALAIKVTPTLDFTLSEDFGYQKPQRYFGTALVNGQLDKSYRRTNYNVEDANIWYKDSVSQWKTEWRPKRNVVVRNNSNVLYSKRHWSDVETYTYVPASGLVNRTSYIGIYHDQVQYGNLTEATIVTGPNSLTAGFSYDWIRFGHENNSPYSGSSLVPLGNPRPGRFTDVNTTPLTAEFRAYQKRYSSFVEDRFQLSRRFSLVGGLRHDRYDIERVGIRTPGTAGKTFDPVSWRGGAVFLPRPDVSLYGQYSTATEAVGTLLTLSAAQQLFDLTPGRQVEFGVKQNIGNGRGEWTMAGYRIVKKKLLIRDPNDPTLQQQIGQQSSRGVELTAAIRLPGGLRVEGNTALLQARYDDFNELISGVLISRNGRTPTNVPQQTANLWLTWNLLRQWQVQGGWRYVGSRFLDTANLYTAPSYSVIDSALRRRLTEFVSIDLRVTNLLDRFYLQSVSGSPVPVRGRFGAPRSVELSLTANF